jgi:hypothetical protein
MASSTFIAAPSKPPRSEPNGHAGHPKGEQRSVRQWDWLRVQSNVHFVEHLSAQYDFNLNHLFQNETVVLALARGVEDILA